MAAEPLSLDLSQCLVAYAGEVITCPECSRPYATFTADAYGPLYRDWPLSVPIQPSNGYCPACSTPYGTTSENAPHFVSVAAGVDLLAKGWANDPRLRLHLSTGWRDMGGE